MDNVYATLLATDSYLPGVQVLHHTLRQFTQRQLVILVSKAVSKASIMHLKKLSNVVISIVPDIGKPDTSDGGWERSQYTKLHIWTLVQYSKVFYIDADCIVNADPEDIFNLDLDFAAAPDVFPPDCFNAGVMLIKPSMDFFKELLSKVETVKSYDGGDTGFLNAVLREQWWASQGRLEYLWNCQRILYWFTVKRTKGYWESLEQRGIKIIHYSSTPKPWEGKPTGDLELLWHSKFAEMCSK